MGACDRGILGDVSRQFGEQRIGLVELTRRHKGARITRQNLRIVGRHLGDLAEHRKRALDIAGLQHLFAHRDQGGDVLRQLPGRAFHGQLAQYLVEHLGQLTFGARIGQVGDQLALEHRIDGGDRLDAELRRDHLLLVDVDLRQDHAFVGIIGGDLFQHGGQLLARAAPLGPEIDDHERGHGRLDDIALERLDRFLVRRAHTQGRHLLVSRS